MISRGRAIDTTDLPGFVAIEEDRLVGIVTCSMEEDDCEIVTLDSFLVNRGIGTLVHINAIEVSRKLKPEIPIIGMDKIPIKHELKFEIRL